MRAKEATFRLDEKRPRLTVHFCDAPPKSRTLILSICDIQKFYTHITSEKVQRGFLVVAAKKNLGA